MNFQDWNKDWKPGPYPKTEAERLAAAKKYGLLPQDYEPYPDDGTGYGDYPKLPVVSADARDPFYNWDYPDQKRNYGETVSMNDSVCKKVIWWITDVKLDFNK